MKLSLNWIKKYVDIPPSLTVSKLSYDLTMCTVEVEDAVDLGAAFDGLVTGKIISVEPHPDADKLRVCSVDVGHDMPSTIVCGGVNLAEGQLVVVAKPGAFVRWHGEGEPVEIKPAKLRGVMSYGMICASGEIGLSELFPKTQDSEIMDISDFKAAPGTPLAVALGLQDTILEIDNKSMTNRPDLWGHYGMARELAAIYNVPLKPIAKEELPCSDGGLFVKIENENDCARYAGLVIEGIKNVPSPFWLKSLLWRTGVRPINLPVDITNYVMLATGQPTHGFDRKHIFGEICVRRSSSGESLELLDGACLELTTDDLVIADSKNPVALAGIMGGKRDSVLSDTTELILEVANFNPLTVRRTAHRFDVRTEASSRFEKGIDPNRVDDALAISVNMFKAMFPDAKITGYADNYPAPIKPAKVEVPMSFLTCRLGRELSFAEVNAILSRMSFKVELKDDILLVEAPSWRSTGDISLPDDILEEIARIMGYENFEFKAPLVSMEKAINQRVPDSERALREYLAFRCNMQEIFTYPWIEDEYVEASGLGTEEMLALSTPPAPNESRLRSSLVPGLLKAIFTNLRYYDEFRVFEFTQVFFDKDYAPLSDESELLPKTSRHVGAAFVGDDAVMLFREAKGVIEYMHKGVQIEPLSFGSVTKPVWAEDKLWLNIVLNDEVIGVLGLVQPKTLRSAGIKRNKAIIFELDFEKLIPLASRQNVFKHLPEYPLVNFDLSVSFDDTVAWADIYQTVLRADLVKDVRFVDEYRGHQVGKAKNLSPSVLG